MQFYLIQFLFKTIMVIFMAVFFIQCGTDDPAREAAKEAALKKSNQPDAPVDETAPVRPVEVGKLPLQVSSAKVAKGEVACLSVKASQFNEIVSMQYTMKWDPAVLTYREVKNFGLPGMTATSFGERAYKQGLLAYSWFDANVQGISKPDGTTLYEVCFEATGGAGSSTSIGFADAPVVIEISNAASQFLGIDAVNGKVEIRN